MMVNFISGTASKWRSRQWKGTVEITYEFDEVIPVFRGNAPETRSRQRVVKRRHRVEMTPKQARVLAGQLERAANVAEAKGGIRSGDD